MERDDDGTSKGKTGDGVKPSSLIAPSPPSSEYGRTWKSTLHPQPNGPAVQIEQRGLAELVAGMKSVP